MALFIRGDNRNVHLDVNSAGNFRILGQAINYKLTEAENSDSMFSENISKTDCSWSIDISDESFSEVWETSLTRAIRKDTENGYASITFYGDNELIEDEYQGSLGVKIALPRKRFLDVFKLFEIVLINDTISYSIVLDFNGFSLSGNYPEWPTFEEFLTSSEPMDGKVYLSNGIEFSIIKVLNVHV